MTIFIIIKLDHNITLWTNAEDIESIKHQHNNADTYNNARWCHSWRLYYFRFIRHTYFSLIKHHKVYGSLKCFFFFSSIGLLGAE